MIRSHTRALGLAGCAMLLAAGSTLAQPPSNPYNRGVPSYNRPVYSPYLNLFRRGGSLLENYQGLVRPELDFRNSINSLGQQVNYNEQQTAQIGSQILPATGHPVYFNNLSHYFSGLRGSTGGIGGGGRAGAGAGGGSGGARGPSTGGFGGAGGASGGYGGGIGGTGARR